MARETSINVRVTNELRAKLEKLAADDDRTLSGYVEKIILIARCRARKTPAQTTMGTSLYRHYGADGRPLDDGISRDPLKRLGEHHRDAAR